MSQESQRQRKNGTLDRDVGGNDGDVETELAARLVPYFFSGLCSSLRSRNTNQHCIQRCGNDLDYSLKRCTPG